MREKAVGTRFRRVYPSAAVVAERSHCPFVVCKRNIALLAFENKSAAGTCEECGKSSSVEEDNRLLFVFQRIC